MSTYLTNQNDVLSAPGLTGAAVTYPKTIPQLTAVGNTFLLFAFALRSRFELFAAICEA